VLLNGATRTRWEKNDMESQMYEESRKLLIGIIKREPNGTGQSTRIEDDGQFKSALSDTLVWHKESVRFDLIRSLLLTAEPTELLDGDGELYIEPNTSETIIRNACYELAKARSIGMTQPCFEIDLTLRNALYEAVHHWYRGHLCFRNLQVLLREIETY
jgi:hypothetical protein